MKRLSPTARAALALLVLGALAFALFTACGPAGFTSATEIDSVRILATRADNDKSYAKPGDTVTLEALTVDGRSNRTPPAVTYWLPFVCENPLDDLYYACFLPGASDAGAAGGGSGLSLGSLEAGTDLTPFLTTGPFTFTVPSDIVASHPVQDGIDPYGLIIVFNIACAGHVELTSVDPANGPQQVPIGCFDDQHNALGPDQYVIGFTRVYASTTKTNANPVISAFHFNDAGYALTTGDGGNGLPAPLAITTGACDASSCQALDIDIDVPPSNWTAGSKSIWVEYFARGGNLSDEGRLLYDITAGQTPDPKNPITYSPPNHPGPATIWAVVHDSNDGVTWVEIDVTAK